MTGVDQAICASTARASHADASFPKVNELNGSSYFFNMGTVQPPLFSPKLYKLSEKTLQKTKTKLRRAR
jgi:hypothetical protein